MVLLSICLTFCQFQPGVAYKSVAYIKKRVNNFIKIFEEMLRSISEAATFLKKIFRSSHQRCSVKIGVLKNFSNFTGKHLCWSLFLIKLQQMFSCEICEIFRKTYFDLLTTASEETLFLEVFEI